MVKLERPLLWLLVLLCTWMLIRQLPVGQALNWVERAGARGELAFVGAFAAAGLVCVPTTPLCLLAGALFPGWRGVWLACLALSLSCGLGFLLARYLLRRPIRRWSDRHRLFVGVNRALQAEGWKMLFVLRLTPAVPFAPGNFFYGLTDLDFWGYLLISSLAMVPGTAALVLAGSMSRGQSHWTPILTGLGFSLGALVWAGRRVRCYVPDRAPRPAGRPWPLRFLAVAMVLAALRVSL
ncbi:MAG: VTT domain-containing protein [Vulcanimicrobiota bacterium]